MQRHNLDVLYARAMQANTGEGIAFMVDDVEIHRPSKAIVFGGKLHRLKEGETPLTALFRVMQEEPEDIDYDYKPFDNNLGVP